MFEMVLLSASIVLFVKVSVVALPTNVSVDVGNVIVPVFEIDEITGVVKVLFVNVSEPAKVANEPSLNALLNCEIVPVTVASDKSTVRVLLALSIVLFVKVSVVSFNTIVPEASGKLIVLSAVGSTTPKTVSLASAVEPSNVNEFVISIVVEFTVVVVPFTVKSPASVKLLNDTLSVVDKLWSVSDKSVAAIVILALPSNDWPAIFLAVSNVVAVSALPVIVPVTEPVIVPVTFKAPVTDNPSAIVIKLESVDDNVVPEIPIAEFCTALVPLPKRIAFDVKVTAPVPPCSTPINSPVWYSAKPVATLLSLKTVRIGVFTVICYSLKEK